MRERNWPGADVVHLVVVLLVLTAVTPAQAERVRTIAECEALVRGRPRELDGYDCLLAHRLTGQQEVLGFLESRLRQRPEDPRPRLYRAIVRYLAGYEVQERDYVVTAEAFAREQDVPGEFAAVSWQVSARCVYTSTCDEKAQRLLWHAGELARTSGRRALLQQWELWRMKVALNLEDLVTAEASRSRFEALGEPESGWLAFEGLQVRAYLAATLRDFRQAQALSRDLLDRLSPGDPRRPLAMGALASATVHLALAGLESRETAEHLIRQALAEQERAQIALWLPQIGYLPSRVQLALLLGPSLEAVGLLRSAVAGYRARAGWTDPSRAELPLAEFLATADPPQLDEALHLAEKVIEESTLQGEYTLLRGLALRSRIRFRQGRFSLARADGLAALDVAERLREHQVEMPIRVRYGEVNYVVYRALAGALLEYRPPDDLSALGDAFQVMERFRARSLMETLLAEEQGATTDRAELSLSSPTLAQIQARLEPREALLSYQVWRPEPTFETPFQQGSSWLTVVTAEWTRLFRLPNGEVLEPQIRAWMGLLERRDGSDRQPGATLETELLRPALDALPSAVDHLIIIPDGPLHRLPFDALSAGPDTPYLVERFSVAMEPSAALWLRFRAAPRLPPGNLLVLADPAAPSGGWAIRGDSAQQGLAYARQEAEVALSVFPVGSELRTGARASESFLKSASLSGSSLLHLGTHAVVDERDPERAAVLLTPGSPSEDGRLEPREIARLPLAGKTVVLAGCETSSGPEFRGEGVMSLARAFFSAGATTVVGTLDRARDDEAGAFFTSMYRAIGRGASVGEAVTEAKREAIRRRIPPAAWADVVLLGDARARPRAARGPGAIPLVMAGVLLACAGLGTARLRRAQREH